MDKDRNDVKSSSSGCCNIDGITDKMRNNFSLEPPMTPLSGELRYLTPLWVSQISPSLHSFHSTENIIANIIISALKLLSFREQRVIVQFWMPYPAGKHQLLTTRDQPFGVGAVDDQGLVSYRKHSERNPFVVHKDHQEADHSPPARVFRRGLPEWTCDIPTNYDPKYFPLQDCAVRCNLHGYLALPVFDITTGLCVGVLELLTASKYTSFAYEVQQVHRVLKNSDLRTPQVFEFSTFNVHDEHRQHEVGIIFGILKDVCRIHRLPLAQTWVVSPMNSFVSHERILSKACNSFDTRCIGKVCMSTAALPFHVQDLGMWPFLKTCREQHLDTSHGVVGRALNSKGLCFCGDVTKLSEEDYPLVHNARMAGLTGCFAIFLHSVEGNNDYVLEFFLPPDMDDATCISNMIQTLKEVASGFELGDTSSVEVVGPTREVSSLSLSIDADAIQIFSTTTTNTGIFEMVSSDSESMVANVTNTDSANVPDQWSSQQSYTNNTENLVGDEVIIKENPDIVKPNASMQKTGDTITNIEEKKNRLKPCRKRKIDTPTMEPVEQHFGKTTDQPAPNLKVSRSTLKTVHVTNLTMPQTSLSNHNLRKSPDVCLSIHVIVFLLIRAKRWSCFSKRHGFSRKWWICGKHRLLPCKSDFIYQAACLMVYWKRWRNQISIKRARQNNRDQAAVCESTSKPEYITNIVNSYFHANWQLSESNFVHESAKQATTTVTVKARFKGDVIKFTFPVSSGLMELENEVARRFELKSRTFRLKYKDEDSDLILVACDADLHSLIGFPTSNITIQLIIVADD